VSGWRSAAGAKEAAVTTTLDGHMAIELVPVKLE